MNTENSPLEVPKSTLSLPDRWIRSRLGKTIVATSTHLEHYRLDLAAKSLYEFTWNEYCDWYLELTKPVLQNEDTPPEIKAATQRTLIEVLETLLRALHPIIPFITEEIWQRVAPVAGVEGATIMLQAFPDSSDFDVDDEAEQELEWIMGFVLGIRQIRGEMDIPPGKPLTVLLQNVSPQDRTLLDSHQLYLSTLARLEDIQVLKDGETPPTSATALLGGMQILVPMAGLIDIKAERERLQKRRDKSAAVLQKIEAKLGNESFVARAPEAVVAKERGRQEDLARDLAQFDAQIAKLIELA